MASVIPLSGLALPALRRQGGYFASKDRYDVAWGDLILALFCPIGSRPMLRSFGSGMRRTLFDLTGASLNQTIEHVVRDTAARWVPAVTIKSVQIRTQDDRVGVLITFGLADDQASQERFVLIPKSDIAQLLAASQGN